MEAQLPSKHREALDFKEWEMDPRKERKYGKKLLFGTPVSLTVFRFQIYVYECLPTNMYVCWMPTEVKRGN